MARRKIRPMQIAVAAGVGALAYTQNWLGLKDKLSPYLPSALGGTGSLNSGSASIPSSVSGVTIGGIDQQQVLREVAAAAKVDPTQVQIVSAQRAVASDASLGCPRPGEIYAQVNTDIYEIICQDTPFYRRWRWVVPVRGGTARVCLIG